MDDPYDAIVVGAGFAGGVAALRLARAGVRTLWLERNERVDGAGRPSGLVLERDLQASLDGEDYTAFPRERRLVDRRLAFLGTESAVSFEYRSSTTGNGEAVRGARTTLRRDRTDPWLAERAQAAGVRLVTGRAADGWTRESDGTVVGVRAGSDSFRATVTVAATGSDDPEASGAPSDAYIAVEDLYRLSADQLDSRFAVAAGEGVAMGCVLRSEPVGSSTQGYLLLHREALSVGVLRSGGSGADLARESEKALEGFVRHPAIAPKLRDAERSHRSVVRRRTGNGSRLPASEAGLVRVGVAAGFWAPGPAGLVELGFAAESARLAADAARDAIRARDPSARRLRRYDESVTASGLRGRVDAAREDGDRLMAPRPFRTVYPRFLEEAFHRLMTEVEGPKRPMSQSLRAARRAVGISWSELARDAAETGRRL